jgi:hypothetical protein
VILNELPRKKKKKDSEYEKPRDICSPSMGPN